MSFTTEIIYFVFNKLLNILLMNLKSIFRLHTSDTQGYRGIAGQIILLVNYPNRTVNRQQLVKS